MAEHNATTTRREPSTLQIRVQDRSSQYNTTSSTCSGATSKLTKAAMARRFLLRGRRQAATSPSESTPQNLQRTGPEGSQTRQLDCVGSPASVMVHTSIIPTSRKHIQERLSLTKHTNGTAAVVAEVEAVATCVLCYDEMDMIDANVHPIVCLNYGCTFNCCTTCTETILDSVPNSDVTDSADIDGTISKLHSKVKCPNCRSDLSRTIYDTALLRLTDRGTHNDHPTSNSTQQQLKIALAEDSGLLYEIDTARKREAQFIEEHEKRSDTVPGITSNIGNSSSGSSFQYNAFDHEIDVWYDYDRTKLIDVTLLCGLENIMTWYEQEKVTRYFTSCQTNQLGMAAKLLYHTRTKLQNQQQQQLDPLFLTAAEGKVPFHESNAITTTICQLIEAGKRARYRTRAASHHHQHHNRNLSIGSTTESPSPTILHRKRPEYYTKLSTQKATQFRKIEHEVRLQTAHMKRYPLPIRLPKYCECRIVIDCSGNENDNVSVSQIIKRLPFRFCNDQWDGTVMDAYTKFVIQRCTTTYDPKKLLHGKNYSGKNLNRPIPTSTFVDNYKVHQRRPYDDINIRNILNIEKYHIASENRDNMDNNTVPTYCDDTRDVCTSTNDTSRYCDNGDDDRIVDDSLVHSPQASRHDSPLPPPPSSSSSSCTNNTSRVMIASVVNMSVASMIFPGDVVTHINGIELRDYTVDDIIALICSLFDSEAAATTTTAAATHNNHLVTPPPPPPPTTSSPIAQTLSLLDGTMNLFTSTSSTSQDTDRSHFFSPPSPKSPVTHHHQQHPDQTSDSNNNSGRQKVLELQFVLNADVAVAKALHLRAMAIRSQQL